MQGEKFENINDFIKWLADTNWFIENKDRSEITVSIKKKITKFTINRYIDIEDLSKRDKNDINQIFYKNFLNNENIKIFNSLKKDFFKNIIFFEVNFTPLLTYIEAVNFTQKDAKEISIEKDIFSDSMCFYGCDFEVKVTLGKQKFKEQSCIIFDKCNFKERVKFNHSQFNSLQFSGCTFDRYLDLSGIHFKNSLTLEFSRVSDLFFNYINKDSNFENFSLKGIAVEKYIFYEDTEINAAANHQTFTILKHNATKSNDTIRAIEFHKQEMDKYFKELWSITFGKKPEEYKGIYFFNRLKSFFNLSILFFEKIVSNYGTSYGHVLFWMFIVNFLFYYHNSFVWRQIEWLNDNFECVVGFSRFFANKVIPFKENIGIRGFVQLVINGVLVYELIKSFRKFSRKL